MVVSLSSVNGRYPRSSKERREERNKQIEKLCDRERQTTKASHNGRIEKIETSTSITELNNPLGSGRVIGIRRPATIKLPCPQLTRLFLSLLPSHNSYDWASNLSIYSLAPSIIFH